MPSSALTSHSTLLTASGWAETSVAGVVAAIGADRCGQLSVRDVEVIVTDEPVDVHYLGTRASFGAFDPAAVVTDARGACWTAASICEAEDVRDLKWESCVFADGLVSLRSGSDLLWDAFCQAALAENEDSLVIKSNREELVGKERFLCVRKTQLDRDCISSGLAGASAWISSCLCNGVDSASADRSSYQLALWFATCRSAMGKGYRFRYDSIQHTCAVGIELGTVTAQVESLRTAFVAGRANRSIIRWTDRSWSPVSSGFVLDGQMEQL